MEEKDAEGYKRLNILRNRFAHNVKADISLQDGIDLYNALGPSFQLETGMVPEKPFRDAHPSTLINRCIKVLHFRLVREKRLLLELIGPSGGPEVEDGEESIAAVPATPIDSVQLIPSHKSSESC